jgi:hypothetical protein
MVVIIIAYLSAWTASNMNFIEEGFSLLTIGKAGDGSFFNACKPLWWDYVTEAGKLGLTKLKWFPVGIANRAFHWKTGNAVQKEKNLTRPGMANRFFHWKTGNAV